MGIFRQSKSPKRVFAARTWGAFLLFSMMTGGLCHAGGLVAGDQGFDFGTVGIDFKVFHTFTLRNQGKTEVTLRSLNVPCECTAVQIADTVLSPAESTTVRVTLDTYSLFGKNSKSFSVQTSDPSMPKFEYGYTCTVGQWPFATKPDPLSMFFLPGQKVKRLAIPNVAHDNIGISIVDQADTVYTVRVIRQQAAKGERSEIEVTPRENLRAGTYLSSFRVRVDLSENKGATLLNIPVKIVRY